jgi:hypothetical protein
MSSTNIELNEFNPSIEVTEILMKTLENATKSFAARCIAAAAARHGFNVDEEIQALGLENLSIIRKQMAKKLATKGEKKERKPREPKKSVLPMPFIAENVDNRGCQGLAYNRSLFTQCLKNRLETGDYCKGCQLEADKNASGCPDCGNVSSRLATGLYEFKDPKGRSPISYVKFLKKLNIPLEQVLEEAGKSGKTIPPEHLVVVVDKNSRGRPKKFNPVVETDNVSDLFAKLSVQEDVLEEEELEEEDLEIEISEIQQVKTKTKLSEAEKEAKRLEKEAEKEAKRLEKEAEKEAKLQAEKEEKEAKKLEKEAKLQAEKEAKKLEKEAKIKEKEAAKEAKRLEKEAEKALKKKDKKVDKTPEVVEPAPQPAPEATVPVPTEVAPVKPSIKVKRWEHLGKQYLKSSATNIVYTLEKEEIGIYDPATDTIKELPQDDEEEEEEYYESN